jgi:hypothetical protein
VKTTDPLLTQALGTFVSYNGGDSDGGLFS